jgi:hypothetical protein
MTRQAMRRWLLGKPGRRWPVDEAPLRTPGQALEEQYNDLMMDVCAQFALLVMIVIVSLWPVVPHLFRGKTQEALGHLTAGVVVAAVAITILWQFIEKKRTALKDIYWGMMMEKYVGQELEAFRADGYSVFHDIEIEHPKCNVDHLLIGPAGVFVIETKSRSKPLKGNVKIRISGEVLLFNGESPDGAPLRQAAANAKQMRELVFKLVGRNNLVCRFASATDVPVYPVLLYPGWYIDYTNSTRSNVHLTNLKRLPIDLRESKPVLKPEEVKELTEFLTKHLRELRRDLFEDLRATEPVAQTKDSAAV